MTSTRVVVSAALVFASALTAHALASQGSSPAPSQAPTSAAPPGGERGQAPPVRQGRAAAVEAGAETRRRRSTRNAVLAATASIWGAGARPACSTTCGHADRTTRRSPQHHERHPEHRDGAVQGTAHRAADLAAGRVLEDAGRKPEGEADLRSRSRRSGDQDARSRPSRSRSWRANLETPWGLAFLPDGRLLITERPGRLRIVEKGQAAAGAGEGHADGLGAAGRRPVRRRGPPAVREERLDLPVVLGAGSEQHGASVGDRGGRGRLAARPRSVRAAAPPARRLATAPAGGAPSRTAGAAPPRPRRRTRRTR